MEEENSNELAEKLLDFNFRVGHWNANHYKKEFNINGKGDYLITSRQFAILLFTCKRGHSTVSQFECMMNISKSSLSLTVSKLVKEGYLRREHSTDNNDGRVVYFYLTEKGSAVLKEAKERILFGFNSFYTSLSKEKKEDLKTGIEKLCGVFEEAK